MSTLTDGTIAEDFVRSKGMGTDRDAPALIGRVESYLREVGLAHRSPLDVAVAALALHERRAAPPPRSSPALTPEQIAFADDQVQGFGDGRTLPDVRDLSMAEYARARSQLGIGISGNHGLDGFLRAGE